LTTIVSSGSKKIDIPVIITTGFDATDEAIRVELSIDKIDQRNTISVNEMIDDAEITEGSTYTDECSIS